MIARRTVFVVIFMGAVKYSSSDEINTFSPTPVPTKAPHITMPPTSAPSPEPTQWYHCLCCVDNRISASTDACPLLSDTCTYCCGNYDAGSINKCATKAENEISWITCDRSHWLESFYYTEDPTDDQLGKKRTVDSQAYTGLCNGATSARVYLPLSIMSGALLSLLLSSGLMWRNTFNRFKVRCLRSTIVHANSKISTRKRQAICIC